MVQPNFLPRTLRGVGGVRLIDLPGVYFPPEMLHESEEGERRRPPLGTVRPAWGISSRDAAALLGCTSASARDYLSRKKVRHERVHEPGCPICLYWHRRQVEKLAAARQPFDEAVPDKLVDEAEACALLRVGRSTLFRYKSRKWLKVYSLRFRTARGARTRHYYRRDQVVKLRGRLNAMKLREGELATLRREIRRGGREGEAVQAAG